MSHAVEQIRDQHGNLYQSTAAGGWALVKSAVPLIRWQPGEAVAKWMELYDAHNAGKVMVRRDR
jgi:hypothetical protein